MNPNLGRNVETRHVELYRDSPFLETVARTPLATCFILFPDINVRWDAVVTANVANFAKAADETNEIPDRTAAELWCDGEAVSRGAVIRSGDLPG